MYGLIGGRLRRWLEGNELHRRGGAPAELSAPAPRPDNGALPTNTGNNESPAAAPQPTMVVANYGSQEVPNAVEEGPSGVNPAPAGTQTNA
jgi:hypothetical protein